jgi:hypothetical protein
MNDQPTCPRAQTLCLQRAGAPRWESVRRSLGEEGVYSETQQAEPAKKPCGSMHVDQTLCLLFRSCS